MLPETIEKQITHAVHLLNKGEVIAYPTEAVYGLGCDPFNQQAVEQLFHVKQRPVEKGVILIAESVEQIQDWVELKDCPWEPKVLETWPGPVTWVLPTKEKLPDWITGGRDSVAIRVTAHPVVHQLCKEFGGPIVSTSANLTGEAPAKSCQQIKQYFDNKVYCLDAALGELSQPTQIWDAKSNQQLR